MSHFDITSKEKELEELESQTTQDGFWNDTKNSSIILKKIKSIKEKCNKYHTIKENIGQKMSNNNAEIAKPAIQTSSPNKKKEIT